MCISEVTLILAIKKPRTCGAFHLFKLLTSERLE